jgi:hypothetical protein
MSWQRSARAQGRIQLADRTFDDAVAIIEAEWNCGEAFDADLEDTTFEDVVENGSARCLLDLKSNQERAQRKCNKIPRLRIPLHAYLRLFWILRRGTKRV